MPDLKSKFGIFGGNMMHKVQWYAHDEDSCSMSFTEPPRFDPSQMDFELLIGIVEG